jgi:excisionase family DNA binding protein
MPLSAEDVEAVARRIVELLRSEAASTFKLVDARELAALLGVSVDYVYEHAAELGALRLGSGRKARIRFDADTARQALESRRRRPAGLRIRAASRE